MKIKKFKTKFILVGKMSAIWNGREATKRSEKKNRWKNNISCKFQNSCDWETEKKLCLLEHWGDLTQLSTGISKSLEISKKNMKKDKTKKQSDIGKISSKYFKSLKFLKWTM